MSNYEPRIGEAGEGSDFHDSSLIDFSYEPATSRLRVVLSTPDERGVESLWSIEMRGVLRIEMESVGEGSESEPALPPEIYDVYTSRSSQEFRRWLNRMKDLGESSSQGDPVYHVVLASSFLRGWGENESLEGISVICREFSVQPASEQYRGKEFSRPRIPGAST